jgi:hypothetical protein
MMYGQRRSTQQQNDEEAQKGHVTSQNFHLGPSQPSDHFRCPTRQNQTQVTSTSPVLNELNTLRQSLTALRGNSLGVSAFASNAHNTHALLQALPPRYAEVWLGLIDRLESSALFSEESCSFSQVDLLDSLAMWLDKAEQQLNKPT